MRIKRIELVNFQIHEKKTVDFTNGLNIIVGDNNSGKSSIIRAIYWTYTNKPAGMWMRRFDPKNQGERLTASVKIVFTDDTVIRRVRGDNENCYYFNDEKFEKFGRSGIPDVIQEYLGRTEMPGIKELVPSIAMQDEQPFMIFESGPNKGSMINYLTGVDIADKIKKELSSETRASRKRNSECVEQLQAHKKDIAIYVNLDEHLALIKKIESKDIDNDAARNQIKSLEALTALNKTIQSRKAKVLLHEAWVAKAENVVALQTKQKALEGAVERCRQVRTLKATTVAVGAYTNALKYFQDLTKEISDSSNKVMRLKELYGQHVDLQKTICNVSVQHKQAVLDMQQFQGMQCPTCNGKIDEKSLCSMH